MDRRTLTQRLADRGRGQVPSTPGQTIFKAIVLSVIFVFVMAILTGFAISFLLGYPQLL
jgi:hypothetical protein